MIFFTSILSNYMSRSLALAESVLTHHPEATFRIYLYDYQEASIPSPDWLTENLHLDKQHHKISFHNSLQCIPKHVNFQNRFNIVEACTAVKPYIASQLIKKTSHVIYLDPDIVVYSRLDINQQDDWDIQLTPHIIKPSSTKNYRAKISERLFANFGIFNLGYLGIKSSEASEEFLAWWIKHCDLFGVANPSAGLYVDQKCFDFAPAFLSNINVVRDPGWNVAWWNIFCDGRELINESTISFSNRKYKLVFFHFSNIDLSNKHRLIAKPLSSYGFYDDKETFILENSKSLHKLFTAYLDRLNQLDHQLPKQYHLSKKLSHEKKLFVRIQRRLTDEIYRQNHQLNAFYASKNKCNYQLDRSRLNGNILISIILIIRNQLVINSMKKHFNKITSSYLNNLLSQSLFDHRNF